MSSNTGFNDIEIKELKDLLHNVVDLKFNPLKEWQEQKDKSDAQNQAALDELLIKMKDGNFASGKKVSFGEAFQKAIAEQFEVKRSDFDSFATDRNAKLTIELKTVGDMSISNLTGLGVSTYNTRQGLIPGQRTNVRDLIPTVQSDTGTYVSYRETGGEGGFALQTEGGAKSQIDYDLTEIKTSSGYIAGFARFSKQLMKNLPFLETTLTRLLLRDFYKAENRRFYDIFATKATGFNTTIETDDALALVDVLMGRLDQGFNNSFILCRHTAVGRILKLLYNNGNYFGAGSIVGTQNGSVSIAGCPVVGVEFIPSYDKAMVIDNDYVERVEVESLRVELSYDDADNFTKNLVTARVECFEDLNLLRTDAHSLFDFGNSASS